MAVTRHTHLACPPSDVKIPAVLYSCANESCAEERSWPARDLRWMPAEEGWYCDLCIDDLHAELLDGDELEVGISLAEWLKSRNVEGLE